MGRGRSELNDQIGEHEMKKVRIADVPLVVASHLDLTGVSVRDIINRDTVGAHRGMLSIAEFAPGGSHKLHRHGTSSQISYLMSGRGEHLTENGSIAIKAGDATYVPQNTWHGFHNTGTDRAVLLSIYSPAAHLADTGYETHHGTIDTSKPAKVAISSIADLQGDATLDEDSGFVGLGVFWLATRDTVGSNDFLLGASTFEPGGLHEHHRHPRGDEFLYILEGGGEHLSLDGAEPLSAGEIAYIPANEYHAFRNPKGVLTRTLFGYFGPATLAEAGYEVRESARP
jgi:quercetin dioxygenase-like cupin family protein